MMVQQCRSRSVTNVAVRVGVVVAEKLKQVAVVVVVVMVAIGFVTEAKVPVHR
jgi:hypothetical protein